MKNRFLSPTAVLLMSLCCVMIRPTLQAQDAKHQPAKPIVVRSRFGGLLLGYDIDHNGTEGMLSEYVLLRDGNLLIATETFDQATGKIIKVIAKKNETQDNFLTWGITGSQIGLQEWEHVTGIYVTKRTYNTINPLDGNKFTRKWTPPFTKDDIIISGPGNQGSPNTAVFYFKNGGNSGPFVIGTNVGANTFTKPVTLNDPDYSDLSVMDFDSKTNQAVIGGSVGCFGCPEKIGLVNVEKRTVTSFPGIGLGLVNGIAVDSATGIACTTSQSDDSAEFYDLAKQSGIIVQLPNRGPYSGVTVANDPVHKLFLITHPEPNSPGEVYVYDEKGNLVNTLTGFPMGPGGVFLALHPSQRTGFAPAAGGTSLMSFSY